MLNENLRPMVGYDHGDDKKLQQAMLENLKKNKEDHADDPEMSKRIHEDIVALETHMKEDEKKDPNAEFPDDLHVGRAQEKI